MSRDYALEPITRAEWGARESDGSDDRALPVREFWLHHTVTVAPDLVPPFTDDDAAIRTLERIGEERFGTGVSYTHPVTPVGRLYVGHSLHRIGSHTRGHNTIGAAFALVGDHTRKAPTAAQVEVIARRMVALHRAGKATRHTLNGGHTEASSPDGGTAQTACPGAGALAAVPTINRRAEDLWRAGYPHNTEGLDMTPDEVAAIVRKVVQEKETARSILTGHPLLVNPLNPKGDRVTLSNVSELTAGAVLGLTSQLGGVEAVVARLASKADLTAEEVLEAARAGAAAALEARIASATAVLEVTPATSEPRPSEEVPA